MEVDSAAAEASSWQLEEVLAWSEDETLDVGGEEEVAGLPFDAAEGEDSDDEPLPAGGAGLWDPSLGEIATLEEEIKKLEFPNLEDGTGNFGEKTMDNAVAMLMAKTGRGFSLKRENKTKVGCEFHLGLWWGADMNTPQVAKPESKRRNLGGTVARVAVQEHSYVESFRTKHLRTFNFVLNAVKYEQCSQHATEDTEAQILGALSYEAIPVVRDEEAARRLFEELVADPTKANLTYDTGSGELVDPSIPTSEAACVSMVSRTSVPHFAELLRDQNVHTVVRITPMSTASECGHLVALGPDGFFLCTCLRQLVYGLLCPHAIKALWYQRASQFNGATISPRWRDSETPWTMAALAAKPAKLSTGAAGLTGPAGPTGQMPPVDTSPIVSSHSGLNLSAYAYANGVALGKELGGMFKEVPSVASIQRLMESMKLHAKQQIEVEKRSLRDESTSRVFTGTLPRPTPALPQGDAGDPGRGGRGRGGKGSTGRGRAGEKGDPGSSSQGSGGGGNGGRRSGGRGGGTGHGRAGGSVNSAGFATGSPSGTTGVRRASHPPAGSDTTSAAPIGFQAAPVNGAHTSEGLALPFRALDNVDVSRRGGGQASPPFQTTAHLVQLGRLQPPPRKKQTGPSKRHKSSSAA
ncbi:expressed unknown protein [Ectocarpus siliculosus]|uniref:SWIM-type domain-containing protein n=1 Tax=Ectocarpus siliculosus TaxID=2880 RepID=D8LJH3_ECTSI|nr:expressed unknown protein [Ectocarpus siliculosus]|eukprot:CBN75974.1 expressed unknown protein [Ectocarpus siliculosus]